VVVVFHAALARRLAPVATVARLPVTCSHFYF
jgi:hypothetical protein